MRILVIHEAEYQDKVVFEFQILPEILASRGHAVFVIDYPQYWKKNSWYDLGTLRTKIFQDVRKAHKSRGVTLIRPGTLKIPILSRISGVISHFLVIGNAIRAHQIDHILLYSVPTNGLATLFWAWWYRVPVLFRLLDVLHEIVPHILLKYPTLMLESFVYRRVDRMSATTPRLVAYARSLTTTTLQIDFHDSGADEALFYPQKRSQSLLKKLGLNRSHQICLFAGSLYRFSGLDDLIRGMPAYLAENDAARLVIVGRGEQEAMLRQLISDLELERYVLMPGFVQYDQLGMYVNLAAVGINPFEINAITKDIFPGKVYQYLACGKPVIASMLTGMTDIFAVADSKNHGIYYARSTADYWPIFDTLIKSRKGVVRKSPTMQQTTLEIEAILEGMSR